MIALFNWVTQAAVFLVLGAALTLWLIYLLEVVIRFVAPTIVDKIGRVFQ